MGEKRAYLWVSNKLYSLSVVIPGIFKAEDLALGSKLYTLPE